MIQPDHYADDLELAAEAASGSNAAQEKIFRLYHKTVFSVCLKITKHFETAEDLAQDCFIQIFRKIHLFRGDARLNTWIHRLALNQSLMYLRKNKNLFFESFDSVEQNTQTTDNEKFEEQIQARILLEPLINRLAPGYRQTLILSDLLGMSHFEIAAVMNVSEGTIKSQISKARKKMRGLINKKCNPRGRFSFANSSSIENN